MLAKFKFSKLPIKNPSPKEIIPSYLSLVKCLYAAGVEPTTYRLGGGRSILLSYAYKMAASIKRHLDIILSVILFVNHLFGKQIKETLI